MKLINSLMQLAIFSVISVSASAKDRYVDIALYWKPTTEISDLKKTMSLADYKKASIKVGVIKDAREVTPLNRIGENREDEKEIKQVETKSDVSEFISKNLTTALEEFGTNVAAEKADYILEGELKEFFSTETNTYKGRIKINLVLKKGPKVVWKETMVGENSRFGRSYKLDNYMENLSDSLIDLVQKVLDKEDFRKVFQTKTGKN